MFFLVDKTTGQIILQYFVYFQLYKYDYQLLYKYF